MIQYDCIWIQWSILYLRDDDLVNTLKLCKQYLNENGIIVVKENVGTDGFFWDRSDNSIMRTVEHMTYLFKKSNLKVLQVKKDLNYPKGYFPLYTFHLQ